MRAKTATTTALPTRRAAFGDLTNAVQSQSNLVEIKKVVKPTTTAAPAAVAQPKAAANAAHFLRNRVPLKR